MITISIGFGLFALGFIAGVLFCVKAATARFFQGR